MKILNELPNIKEFYKSYWGKQPFLVRNAVKKQDFDSYIDGDSLAGLALDEDIKSRIVLTPRWLMDDIMVSYSAKGGSVGGHMDSYHVFLVQGKGKRRWKVSNKTLQGKECLNNKDLLVFKEEFEGHEVEVETGDVIYIPPYFGHQGVTIEEAMTFSVGFLGPKISDILSEYCYYLEENPELNKRYMGQELDESSAGFKIPNDASKLIQSSLIKSIKDDNFSNWLAEYFLRSNDD